MRFIDGINDRIYKQNKNWMCVVVGETGSGKSYCAMRIGEILDPEFSIKRVCFTPKEFMDVLNSGELKKGSAIILDEAGISLSSREWFTVSNKLMNYILQSFRHRNLFCLFTVPSLSFIDSQSRVLFHHLIEPVKIIRSKNMVKCKIKEIQVNPQSGKSYYKRPRASNNVVLNRINISKPSLSLINDYELKKTRFTKEMGKDIQNTLNTLKIKQQRPITNDVLVDKLKGIMKEKGMNTISVAKTRAYLGISEYKARIIKELVMDSVCGR